MYALESILRKELPTGKLYIEEAACTAQWHREMQSSLGRHSYALYNNAMVEFENANRVSKPRRPRPLQGRKRVSTLTYLDVPMLSEQLQQAAPRFIEMGGTQVPVPSNPDAWHAVNEIVRDVVKEVVGE